MTTSTNAALAAQVRRFADNGHTLASVYSEALAHPATTGNDRDALRRIMYGNAWPGDVEQLHALAHEIAFYVVWSKK